ncbi:MAG: hypothetical protein CMH55_00875 [Myxococcales bacterium]|nr:hypothetical protein [Myxococcales bacterium]
MGGKLQKTGGGRLVVDCQKGWGQDKPWPALGLDEAHGPLPPGPSPAPALASATQIGAAMGKIYAPRVWELGLPVISTL